MQRIILFDVPTPLGFRVHTTVNYWEYILSKHPDMAERLSDVTGTLIAPDEIWHNPDDPELYEFYRFVRRRRYLRVVARNEAGGGYLVNAYPADYIKARVKVWPT